MGMIFLLYIGMYFTRARMCSKSHKTIPSRGCASSVYKKGNEHSSARKYVPTVCTQNAYYTEIFASAEEGVGYSG